MCMLIHDDDDDDDDDDHEQLMKANGLNVYKDYSMFRLGDPELNLSACHCLHPTFTYQQTQMTINDPYFGRFDP